MNEHVTRNDDGSVTFHFPGQDPLTCSPERVAGMIDFAVVIGQACARQHNEIEPANRAMAEIGFNMLSIQGATQQLQWILALIDEAMLDIDPNWRRLLIVKQPSK